MNIKHGKVAQMPVLEILSNLYVMLCFNGVLRYLRSMVILTTNPLIARPLSGSLNVNCCESRLFGTKAIPLLTSEAAVGKAFSVFTYDATIA